MPIDISWYKRWDVGNTTQLSQIPLFTFHMSGMLRNTCCFCFWITLQFKYIKLLSIYYNLWHVIFGVFFSIFALVLQLDKPSKELNKNRHLGISTVTKASINNWIITHTRTYACAHFQHTPLSLHREPIYRYCTEPPSPPLASLFALPCPFPFPHLPIGTHTLTHTVTHTTLPQSTVLPHIPKRRTHPS